VDNCHAVTDNNALVTESAMLEYCREQMMPRKESHPLTCTQPPPLYASSLTPVPDIYIIFILLNILWEKTGVLRVIAWMITV